MAANIEWSKYWVLFEPALEVQRFTLQSKQLYKRIPSLCISSSEQIFTLLRTLRDYEHHHSVTSTTTQA